MTNVAPNHVKKVVAPNSAKKDVLSSSGQNKDPPIIIFQRKDDSSKENVDKKDVFPKEVEKTQNPFKFETELSKLKISNPLSELLNNDQFRTQILKVLGLTRTIRLSFLVQN